MIAPCRPNSPIRGGEYGCIALALLLLAIAPGFSGCRQEVHSKERILCASIPPIGAILREIAGDRVQVITLLTAGASPHTYEPKPSDAHATEHALGLFYAAEDIDGWAVQLPTVNVVETSAWIPESMRQSWDGAAGVLSEVSEAEHEHGHHHGNFNTHYWGDPLLVKAMLPRFLDTICSLDPEGAAVYKANALHFSMSLEALDGEMGSLLQGDAGKRVALFHSSWNYFFVRYGIPVAGVVEPYGSKEASPLYLKRLIDRFKQEKISAVFTERQLNRRPSEVVAESGGWPLGELDPLGGDSGRERYADLLRYNARIVRETLQ